MIRATLYLCLHESVPGHFATGCWKKLPKGLEEFGLIPHDQPAGPLVANLAAFWQQMLPIMLVLPTVPTRKSRAVYNLTVEALHGMKEFVGKSDLEGTEFPE